MALWWAAYVDQCLCRPYLPFDETMRRPVVERDEHHEQVREPRLVHNVFESATFRVLYVTSRTGQRPLSESQAWAANPPLAALCENVFTHSSTDVLHHLPYLAVSHHAPDACLMLPWWGSPVYSPNEDGTLSAAPVADSELVLSQVSEMKDDVEEEEEEAEEEEIDDEELGDEEQEEEREDEGGEEEKMEEAGKESKAEDAPQGVARSTRGRPWHEAPERVAGLHSTERVHIHVHALAIKAWTREDWKKQP